MSWLTTAQNDQEESQNLGSIGLIRDISSILTNSSRFYLGKFYYTLSLSDTKWTASKINISDASVPQQSTAYKQRLNAVKWIASEVYRSLHDWTETEPELDRQFSSSRRVSIGSYEYAPIENLQNGTYVICSYPDTSEVMSPYRNRPPSMSTRVHLNNALILNLIFSRFSDLATFITSSSFFNAVLYRGSANLRLEEGGPSVRPNERPIPSLIGIMRELADLNEMPNGFLVTGNTLIADPGDLNPVFENAEPDDVFLSFSGGLTPEPSAFERFISALRAIVGTHFPNRRVDVIESNSLGPLVSVRRSETVHGTPPNPEVPVEIKHRAPPVDHDVEQQFETLMDQDDEDFGVVFASQKGRKPIVVSFDYDGTTVFPDDIYETNYDEYGEVVSSLNPEAAELMRLHASRGDKIVIVTCRTPDSIGSIWKMIRENGLPVSEVYATSHTDKSPTLKSVGASIHYEDSPFRRQEITQALGPSIRVYQETEMSDNIRAWRGQ